MRQHEKKFSKKKQNKPTKQKQKIYGVKTLDFYALTYYKKQNEICVSCLQENHHLVDYNTATFANP